MPDCVTHISSLHVLRIRSLYVNYPSAHLRRLYTSDVVERTSINALQLCVLYCCHYHSSFSDSDEQMEKVLLLRFVALLLLLLLYCWCDQISYHFIFILHTNFCINVAAAAAVTDADIEAEFKRKKNLNKKREINTYNLFCVYVSSFFLCRHSAAFVSSCSDKI